MTEKRGERRKAIMSEEMYVNQVILSPRFLRDWLLRNGFDPEKEFAWWTDPETRNVIFQQTIEVSDD